MAEIPKDAVVINVDPHPGQWTLINALRDTKNREVYLRKGRRWGGTWTMGLCCTEFAIQNPKSPGLQGKPTEIAFFGPLYENARKLWREVIDSFGPTLLPGTSGHRESDLSLIWRGGARGKCYSGENAAAALGSGFDIVIVDEASNFPAHLVRQIITPTLADRGGRLWVPSSPRHGANNWFAQRCLKAESGAISGVVGFHFSTYDNPRISRDWIEAQRTDPDMDDATFDEEYRALILQSSSSWLDPTKIKYIPSKQIPGNTYNTLHGDFAFAHPEPGMIDPLTRRRKDFNVLAPVSQDALGNVYLRLGGLYEKYADQDQVFDAAARLIRDYSVTRFCFEREVNVHQTTTDNIGRLWNIYREKHNVPNVGLVRPHRGGHWKNPQLRSWSTLLKYGKFFIEQDDDSGQTALLDQPLRQEMMEYSETAAARDKCHDDVLVAVSDVMQPLIYQGKLELESRHVPRMGPDLYHLQDGWDSWSVKHGRWNNEDAPRQSKYGPV